MPDLGFEVLLQGKNLIRLLGGFWVSLRISMISFAASVPLGTVFGIIMARKKGICRAFIKVCTGFICIIPQLVMLFIVYFGSAKMFNLRFSGELSAIIVFALWGTAEMCELVRGAVTGIPPQQYETGKALGLTETQLNRYIIIPQSVHRLLPLSINLLTRIIKTASLVLMIGVAETLKTAQQIIEFNRMSSPNAAFGIYLTVFFLYFIVCWSISLLARYLERRWN